MTSSGSKDESIGGTSGRQDQTTTTQAEKNLKESRDDTHSRLTTLLVSLLHARHTVHVMYLIKNICNNFLFQLSTTLSAYLVSVR